MNSTILDVLTETELRDTKVLEASISEHISAGIPWLTDES